MTRVTLVILAAVLCFAAGGCLRAEFDPGIRVRTPTLKIRR